MPAILSDQLKHRHSFPWTFLVPTERCQNAHMRARCPLFLTVLDSLCTSQPAPNPLACILDGFSNTKAIMDPLTSQKSIQYLT